MRTKRFSLRKLKTGSSFLITSTRMQAEIPKLAWPRGSHPARSTRVYNVLAYFYADYFDAGTPALTDKAGVQRPLGIVQYLSKFVPNLADLTKSLRDLT